MFRRRFATDVHLAACCEIERPAEPVSASVVDIVSLWRAFLPLYLGPLWTSEIARGDPLNLGFDPPGPQGDPPMTDFLYRQEVVVHEGKRGEGSPRKGEGIFAHPWAAARSSSSGDAGGQAFCYPLSRWDLEPLHSPLLISSAASA